MEGTIIHENENTMRIWLDSDIGTRRGNISGECRIQTKICYCGYGSGFHKNLHLLFSTMTSVTVYIRIHASKLNRDIEPVCEEV